MTPAQRDREARAVAAIARACGFPQPVAPLILRRVPDVERLLRADDATVRRVVADPSLRGKLRAGLVAGFRDVWRQATLERLRVDHGDWLRSWWLPVTSSAELDRLLRTPAPRPDHRRVALARTGYPATAAAAELLADADHRGELDGYLVVERRIATAVLDLAGEVAREDDVAPSGDRRDAGELDRPPAGVDPRDHPHVAWWHAG